MTGDNATKNQVGGQPHRHECPRGTAGLANADDGVEVQAPSNTIGGPVGGAINTVVATTGGDRNIISGNGTAGVMIETTATLVENNAIGTNIEGTGVLAVHPAQRRGDQRAPQHPGRDDAPGQRRDPGERDLGQPGQRDLSGGERLGTSWVEGNFIGIDATGSERPAERQWRCRADGPGRQRDRRDVARRPGM